MSAPNNPCTLKPGVHVQVYRDAIRGASPAAKLTALDKGMAEAAANGAAGVVLHGFTGDLTRSAFDFRALMARKHGLQCSASFGLGERDSLTPEKAGTWMGQVAQSPDCAALVIDAEGAWEQAGDKEAATAMGVAFRRLAPRAYVVTQPWPVPTVHSAFPEKEFAAWTDADARQAYYNDWKRQHGRQRCKILRPWFAASQKTLFTRIEENPQLVTLQAYAWDDILHELVTELLAQPIVILWSDPFPTESTYRAMRAVRALAARGFTGPRAVWDFQASRPEGVELDVDGICGPKTFAALGL